MSSVDTTDFDAFMSKVDIVHSAVKGLKDGTTSVQQSQHILTKLQPPPLVPNRIEEHKEQLIAAVRNGPGVGDNYRWWCGQCRLEYEEDMVRRCERCGGSLTSREQRHTFLKQKVQRLKAEKQARRERRERFKALKLQRQADNSNSSLSLSAPSPSPSTSTTNTSLSLLPTSAWEDYEPSSSSDSDSSRTAHSPAFAALEADLSARQHRRQLDTQAAESHKAAGNRAFATHHYDKAAECYTAAIERRRGEKVYYANRAACWVKLERWDECVKDCSAVLDVWELIERGEEKRKQRGGGSSGLAQGEEVVVKALMRRSEAWKAMKEWDKAHADLERATLMEAGSNSKRLVDIRRLLTELQVQQSEQQKDAEARLVEGRERETVLSVLLGMEKGERLKVSTVAGARQLLLEADDKWRVVLRSERGVEVVMRWLSERQQVAGKEERLVVEVMDLLWAAAQNERNKDEVVVWKGVELLTATVDSHKSSMQRRQSAWQLLATVSERAQSRRYALSKQPSLFLSAIKTLSSSSSTSLLQPVVSLLANLAFDDQWKTHMRGNSHDLLSTILPLWCTQSLALLSSLSSLLSNLSTQPTWRPLIASHPQLLSAIGGAFNGVFEGRGGKEEDGLVGARQNVLGLALNMSLDGGAVLSRLLSYIRPSLPQLLAVLRDDPPALLQSRLLAVLAKAVTAAELREQLVEQQVVDTALSILEHGVVKGSHTKLKQQHGNDTDAVDNDPSVETMEHATRLVAACTTNPTTTRLLTSRPPLLNSLLASPSPFLAGNTALIVSILAQQPALHESLSVCVLGLLRVMRECSGRDGSAGRVDAANNAAIACARLARYGDNLAVIRANGGMALVAAAGKKSLH